MKIAILIARILLGALFVFSAGAFWFGKLPPPPPTDTPVGMFTVALFSSGYMSAVKVCELLGGLLVLSGRFTGLGLLFLGPVILNILFFDAFLAHAFNPASALAAIFALFLLWTKRERFVAFITS